MQIIALYHPEEETRMLLGKAIVRRILKSDAPEERKAAMLSAISKEGKCHIEAREDAGKALCEITRKAKNWEKSYSMAMDSNYPPETRNMAASDFLDNADGHKGIATVLGCAGISEKLREEKGFGIVKEALDNGNTALSESIRAEKGLPQMLALYLNKMFGAARPRFAKERISEPPLGNALAKVQRKI
jgi:hypothetical protein